MEPQLNATAKNGPWREFLARLRCLRGVDTLAALGLVAEIGTDWLRLRRPDDSAIHSEGDRISRGGGDQF